MLLGKSVPGRDAPFGSPLLVRADSAETRDELMLAFRANFQHEHFLVLRANAAPKFVNDEHWMKKVFWSVPDSFQLQVEWSTHRITRDFLGGELCTDQSGRVMIRVQDHPRGAGWWFAIDDGTVEQDSHDERVCFAEWALTDGAREPKKIFTKSS